MLESKDLRDKQVGELKELLAKTRRELLDTKFHAAAGGLKDRSLIGKKKKDIARILTIINEKTRAKEAKK